MQNVPVGWGDAVDAVMLPMELGWNQAIRRGLPNVGARARRKESPHRGVSERRDEYCERAWMDLAASFRGLTECWFC